MRNATVEDSANYTDGYLSNSARDDHSASDFEASFRSLKLGGIDRIILGDNNSLIKNS
jgi:hypothetical protein